MRGIHTDKLSGARLSAPSVNRRCLGTRALGVKAMHSESPAYIVSIGLHLVESELKLFQSLLCSG